MFFVNISWVSYAQNVPEVMQDDLEIIQTKCQQYVESLQAYMEILGDRSQVAEVKEKSKKAILKMFIHESKFQKGTSGDRPETIQVHLSSFVAGKLRVKIMSMVSFLHRLSITCNNKLIISKAKVYVYSKGDLKKIHDNLYIVDCYCFDYDSTQTRPLSYVDRIKDVNVQWDDKQENRPTFLEVLFGDICIAEYS